LTPQQAPQPGDFELTPVSARKVRPSGAALQRPELAPRTAGPESPPAGLAPRPAALELRPTAQELRLARMGLRLVARMAQESPQLEAAALGLSAMRRPVSIC
jgi:hypothetical protein